jgi:hypothetical protein
MTDVTLPTPSSSELGAGLWKRAKKALPSRRGTGDGASLYMLRLFRTNLEVRLRTIDETSLQSEHQKKIYATVTEMLKPPVKGAPRNIEWDDMYKAESLIAMLLGGAQLREEISGRLNQLSAESPNEAEALRRDYETMIKPLGEANAKPDDCLLRAFLLRVMEAIHWSSKKKYLARPIRKDATKSILKCTLIAFCLLIAPYLYLLFDFTVPIVTSDGTITHAVNKVWSLFALYTALTAGLLGAFFSRLMKVQGSWDDMALEELFLHREFSYTLLRAGVGVCGALIVYFFLRLGIADSALFPKFDNVRLEFVNIDVPTAVQMTFVMPSQALALLTFWCFLAGFSERLVPGILSSTERQLGAAAAGQAPRK